MVIVLSFQLKRCNNYFKGMAQLSSNRRDEALLYLMYPNQSWGYMYFAKHY